MLLSKRRGFALREHLAAGPFEREALNVRGLEPDRADEGDERRALGRSGSISPVAAEFDVGDRKRLVGEAEIDHRGRVIGERGFRRVGPQRMGSTSHAPSSPRQTGSTVAPLWRTRKMQMGKFGLPGEADQPERRAGFDALAVVHANGAFGHVAVLRFPSAVMADDDAVAAFATGHARKTDRAHVHIGHAVAHGLDDAGRGRQHRHAVLLRRHCRHAQIDAVVAVIGHRAAAIVFHPRRRIVIDILLDETGLAEFAVERQREAEGRLLLLSGGARRACGHDKQRQCDTDNDTKRQGALLDCAGLFGQARCCKRAMG